MMKPFVRMRSPIIGVIVFLISGCSTPSTTAISLEPEREFSLEEVLSKDGGKVGCRKMLDSYCSALHSPNVEGNILVGRGPQSYRVLQGRTKNDFSNAYYLYATAKLRARETLPTDFRTVLNSQAYFDLLEVALARIPRSHMSLDRRLRSLRREFELDKIWNVALSETVVRRMAKKFPGYHQLRDDLLPIEQSVERVRVRRELISKISRAIWKRDHNWSKVESSFEKLRSKFLSIIDALDIPEEVRTRWRDRISTVELVIPGAIPAIADTECSTTQANAFYYSHLNLITVCAGDFNSEDILQTVAHELAHSLDLDRYRYVFQKDSKLGVSLTRLRREVCTPEVFSCQAWDLFKTNFQSNLSDLNLYSPELPEFQRCLKRRSTSKVITDADIDRMSEREISDQVSDLARGGVFLRITKDRVPLPNGKTTKNPNYLNPCGYKMWSLGEEPVDDELSQLLFFTAEYRCNPAEDPNEKLRLSITASKEMAVQIAAATLRMEGEFSAREDLEEEGFSSSPSERFADVLGSYAFASYLSDLNDKWARRHTFLASSSWQCEEPSLESHYPEENAIQQGFVFDSHSEGETRKKEMFTTPIQSVLGCVEDFQFKACELRFKSGASVSRVPHFHIPTRDVKYK